MSIPISLEDPDVLKRTLEELYEDQIHITSLLTTLDTLPEGASLEEVTSKVNILVSSLNKIASILNSTLR